jgi:hypothetical protein
MLEELEQVIVAVGDKVMSTDKKQYSYQMRTEQGGVINFYPSTGEIVFQGKAIAKDKIKIQWEKYKIEKYEDIEENNDLNLLNEVTV